MRSLRLPKKKEVQYFREKRLLIHLHEQLVEQIDHDHGDWQLHFQLANLLAFSAESFYKDRKIDRVKSELHYQQSLTLLRQLHEQNYIIYQNHITVNAQFPYSPDNNARKYEFGGSTTDKDMEEEKRCQPELPELPEICPQLLSMSRSNHSVIADSNAPNEREKQKRKKKKSKHTKQKSNTDGLTITIDTDQQKKRRKKASIRERDPPSANHDTVAEDKSVSHAEDHPPPKFRMKKRKLMIIFRDDDNEISKQIRCKYSSPMSKEEIDKEKEEKAHKHKKRKKRSKRLRMDITRKYIAALHRLNHPKKAQNKRPSIIMMYTPNSPHNGGRITRKTATATAAAATTTQTHTTTSGNQSPISLFQSESETVAELEEYVVPPDIIKGYTECFFGYGKYLVNNRRVKEGVHNLLECASWYDDSFVDPSCLTSLVLPPQFLFQDSVKKRHCINFRTLTKYISRILGNEQKHLDKQFTQMNIAKYIKQYEQYLEAYEDEIQEHLTIVVNGGFHHDPDDTHSLSAEGSASSINELEGFSLGPSRLKLEGLQLSTKEVEHTPIHSETSLSPMLSPMAESPLLSPMLSPQVSYTGHGAGGHEHEHKPKNVINYQVYPQPVQELVTQYEDLCAQYQRLGVLLTDFLRYSDAKREFNRALVIFRKLKIKPPLYEELVSAIRNAQNQSTHTPSGRERAQYLAKKHQTPSSRSNIRAPISPSFEFSFSDHFTTAALHQHPNSCAVH